MSQCHASQMPVPGHSAPRNRIALYIHSYSKGGSYAAMQERRLREMVEAFNRYRAFGDVIAVFKDEGTSFSPASRAGLRALVKAVRKRRITLVLVPEFRDLATLPRDLLRLLRTFDRHGCGLRSRGEYLLFEDLRGEEHVTRDPIKEVPAQVSGKSEFLSWA